MILRKSDFARISRLLFRKKRRPFPLERQRFFHADFAIEFGKL